VTDFGKVRFLHGDEGASGVVRFFKKFTCCLTWKIQCVFIEVKNSTDMSHNFVCSYATH